MENVMIWGRFWVHHEADRNKVYISAAVRVTSSDLSSLKIVHSLKIHATRIENAPVIITKLKNRG